MVHDLFLQKCFHRDSRYHSHHIRCTLLFSNDFIIKIIFVISLIVSHLYIIESFYIVPLQTNTITTQKRCLRKSTVGQNGLKYNADGTRRNLNSLDTKVNNNNLDQEKKEIKLYFKLSPLIGGPSFLPVHVKVILESTIYQHAWDFVPLDPTEPETVQKLLSFQGVNGEIRYFVRYLNDHDNNENDNENNNIMFLENGLIINGNNKNPIIKKNVSSSNFPIDFITTNEKFILEQANLFCQSYMNTELHLITNNCWTFAIQLYLQLLWNKDNNSFFK